MKQTWEVIMFVCVSILLMAVASRYVKMVKTLIGDHPKKKEDAENAEEAEDDIVVKKHYVIGETCQRRTTHATSEETVSGQEKADTFAPETKEIPAAIPAGELDDAFRDTPAETGSDGEDTNKDDDFDPASLDIAPDEENESPIDPEEEAEELRKVLGREADPAAGLSMEEMQEAVKAGRDPKPQDAELFQKIERTDLFEIVVAGDTDKTRRITEIIERHLRDKYPEPEEENNDGDANEADGFNLEGFLGRTIKR